MSAPIAGMCCSNCLYFERTDERFGECRRHAPQPNACAFVPKMESIGKIHVDIHWPKVFNNSWCGQFSRRKKVQSPQKTPPKKMVVTPPVRREDEEELKLQPLEPEPKVVNVPEVEIIE